MLQQAQAQANYVAGSRYPSKRRIERSKRVFQGFASRRKAGTRRCGDYARANNGPNSSHHNGVLFVEITLTNATTLVVKPTDSSAAGSTAGSAAAGRPSDGAGAAARYYPATGMWCLPGAVQGRRRRAAVLQGARLQRVRERGRGDRHVPVLRRGPVAAAGGGLLQRRGDRARAVEELGVIRKQYLETIVN